MPRKPKRPPRSRVRKPKPPPGTFGPGDPRIVARVTALLARAADPGASEEEARTSAVIAARLIREHAIPVGAPPPAPPPPLAPMPAPPGVPADIWGKVVEARVTFDAFGDFLRSVEAFRSRAGRR